MTNLPGQMPPILFEDPHLVVVNKPSGMLSQSDHSGDKSLVDFLRVHFGRHYVGLIHRLDRETSGLLVVAKRTKAAQRLTESLQKGDLERRYQAWVHGELPKGDTPIQLIHWLKKDESTNKSSVFSAERPGTKRAVLQYQCLKKIKNYSLCSFQLDTGRSHQIRAQMAFIGHPLAGDKKYGAEDFFPHPLLHSFQIQFPHPMSKEILVFQSPLPENWKKWIVE